MASTSSLSSLFSAYSHARTSSKSFLSLPATASRHAFALRAPPRPSLSLRPQQRHHQPRCYSQAIPDRVTTPAPSPSSGPLLHRDPNRALPSLAPSRLWLKTLPLFIAIITLSSLAIFNYQKSSSSVVSSTLYALRVNDKAREVLGDEIYFASKVPWIGGELNQLHGVINLSFWVKGTRGQGRCRFRSVRRERRGFVSLFSLCARW